MRPYHEIEHQVRDRLASLVAERQRDILADQVTAGDVSARRQRLVALAGTASGTASYDDVSWPDFLDLQRSCRLIDAFIADRIVRTTLSVGDRAERATGSVVSANYFAALGVRPILGRGFEPGEDVGRDAHPVVVISYRTWQDRYGGDPAVRWTQENFDMGFLV